MGFPTAGYGSGWDQFAADPSTQEIEFALKNFYLPGMEEQKNNARVLLANLERNEKDVSGSFACVPVLLGRNWGIGMRANRQQLPEAGYQRGDRAQIPMRYAFGQLIVTLHAMAATKNRFLSGAHGQAHRPAPHPVQVYNSLYSFLISPRVSLLFMGPAWE